MKLFEPYLISVFVRDSGMKLLDLSGGILLERVWHETM